MATTGQLPGTKLCGKCDTVLMPNLVCPGCGKQNEAPIQEQDNEWARCTACDRVLRGAEEEESGLCFYCARA